MSELGDRQAASSRQGAAFEDAVAILLQVEGWTIIDTHWRQPDVFVEIDIVATNREGQEWWIECKGSWESSRGNGLERTDTLKKAIGSAAILRSCADRKPYMLVTSHLPRVGSSGDRWLEITRLEQYFDAISVVSLNPRPTNPSGTEGQGMTP